MNLAFRGERDADAKFERELANPANSALLRSSVDSRPATSFPTRLPRFSGLLPGPDLRRRSRGDMLRSAGPFGFETGRLLPIPRAGPDTAPPWRVQIRLTGPFPSLDRGARVAYA